MKKQLERSNSRNTRVMSASRPSNLEEVTELRNEGGSDVFTSTRHVNANANQSSSDFKLKFWSNDDSPLIRPILRTEPYSAPTNVKQVSIGVNHHQMDGYGGIACERVTKITGRSGRQWMAGYAAIILSGSAVFALLLKYKNKSKPAVNNS